MESLFPYKTYPVTQATQRRSAVGGLALLEGCLGEELTILHIILPRDDVPAGTFSHMIDVSTSEAYPLRGVDVHISTDGRQVSLDIEVGGHARRSHYVFAREEEIGRIRGLVRICSIHNLPDFFRAVMEEVERA